MKGSGRRNLEVEVGVIGQGPGVPLASNDGGFVGVVQPGREQLVWLGDEADEGLPLPHRQLLIAAQGQPLCGLLHTPATFKFEYWGPFRPSETGSERLVWLGDEADEGLASSHGLLLVAAQGQPLGGLLTHAGHGSGVTGGDTDCN